MKFLLIVTIISHVYGGYITDMETHRFNTYKACNTAATMIEATEGVMKYNKPVISTACIEDSDDR